MVLTTTSDSITTVRSPARCAAIEAANPHGPPPMMRTSTSDMLVLGSGWWVMGSGGRDSRPRRITHHLSPFYDLIALRSNADVRDRRLDRSRHRSGMSPPA